jgi:hypothetical protein
VNGACGSANGSTSTTEPTTNLCTSGTPTTVTASGTYYTWGCAGINGGASASCASGTRPNGGGGGNPPPPNYCGSANGTTTNVAPTANLCTTGATASTVTGDGSTTPWAWPCTEGATTSQCQAYPPGYAIQCDYGPPYTGAIPANATQAGFTHCAANYDFTYTGSWTDSMGTHQWCAGSLPCSLANMSSWLSCTGNGLAPPTLWYLTSGTPCDTNHVQIAVDPSTGTQTWCKHICPATIRRGYTSISLITMGKRLAMSPTSIHSGGSIS